MNSESPERRGSNRDVSAEQCCDVATVPGTPGSYSCSDPREDARTPAGSSIALPRSREICPGCGNEIDPDTCGCGDAIEGHSIWSGHSPIPMGCDCGRVKTRLPEGKTCLDCVWFVRCNVVLGVAQLGQQDCDWDPSRYQDRHSDSGRE